jgi:hypothetical protein
VSRILYVAPFCHIPPIDGASQRGIYLLRELARQHDMRFWSDLIYLSRFRLLVAMAHVDLRMPKTSCGAIVATSWNE